jgi:hypothetical protein
LSIAARAIRIRRRWIFGARLVQTDGRLQRAACDGLAADGKLLKILNFVHAEAENVPDRRFTPAAPLSGWRNFGDYAVGAWVSARYPPSHPVESVIHYSESHFPKLIQFRRKSR